MRFKTWSMRLLSATAACLALSSTGQAAVTLQLSGSTLIGALGVDVGGVLYDVNFGDGSCVSLFSGCDALGDFPFPDAASTSAAMAALGAQVFLDVAQGAFDSDPSLTQGCTGTTSPDSCFVWTPFALPTPNDVSTARFVNGSIVDSTNTSSSSRTYNTGSLVNGTYAVWTLASTGNAVPAPSTLALLGAAALAALLTSGRRRPAPANA